MRTFFGILRSRVLSESVVLSAINACQYSVSVLVWKIFGQLWLLRQRSSWPAFTSEILSWNTPQVCDDSAPGNWRSVCCVPDRRSGWPKRTLNAPRFDALCGMAPSTTRLRFSSWFKPGWVKVRVLRPLCGEPEVMAFLI